ncbi:hypothetical protein [Trueperella pyogenes]|uniref:hypothetical protein n=1 Tax=Trueperella pyogenes TaxID=1661 RepID=UPI00131D0A20|nr:hypothetical protein [Trueperella pyogenes]
MNLCKRLGRLTDHRHVSSNELCGVRNPANVLRLPRFRKRNLLRSGDNLFNLRRSNGLRAQKEMRQVLEFRNFLCRNKGLHSAHDRRKVGVQLRIQMKLQGSKRVWNTDAALATSLIRTPKQAQMRFPKSRRHVPILRHL